MLLGTIVNTVGILLGGGIGLIINYFLKRGIPERYSERIMQGIGLCTIYIAASTLLDGTQTLVTILSFVFGAALGEWLNLDGRVKSISKRMEQQFDRNGSGSFTRGFLSAFLLFCVGTMAIQGSLNAGLTGDNDILYSKSLMDTISACIFASTLGIGVLFSVIPLFLYQGGITLLASFARPFLTQEVIGEMNTIGSLLLFGISLDLLGIKSLKLMNFLPAMFLPILFCLFF